MFMLKGIGVVSCHLAVGKLELNADELIAQLPVCSRELLKPRNGFSEQPWA